MQTNSCSFNLYISDDYSDGIGVTRITTSRSNINKKRSENDAVSGSMSLKVVLDIVIHGVLESAPPFPFNTNPT